MATLESLIIDDTGFLKFPTGNTSQRPSSPPNGTVRFNTSTNKVEFWNSTKSKFQEFSSKLDGKSTSTAFHDLDELSNQYSTNQTLYHTFYGNFDNLPEIVDVSFSNTSEPKYQTTYNTSASSGISGVGGKCVGLNGTINACNEGLGPNYNLYSAMRACIRSGMRLCTRQEIQEGAGQGSGCGHDGNAIWTSTKSSDGRFFVVQGNYYTTANAESTVYPTEDQSTRLINFDDNRIGIRCCAPFSGSEEWDIR